MDVHAGSVGKGPGVMAAKLHAGGTVVGDASRTVESNLRLHLVPFFRATPVNRIEPEDVERLIDHLLAPRAKGGAGLKRGTVVKAVALLSGILDLAQRKRWIGDNPCRLAERPEAPRTKPIYFLTMPELDALVAAIPAQNRNARLAWEQVCELRASTESNLELAKRYPVSDSTISKIKRGLIWTDEEASLHLYAAIDRAIILTAALTGLRQGELLALRRHDIDWRLRKLRVRESYVRGEFGTPKTATSARPVPLALRVVAELDTLLRDGAFQGPEDLVFCHPHTGQPLDRSLLLKRFKGYCRDAGLPEHRFHDLRHTFGTQAASSKQVSRRQLQGWLGHASAKTTEIYAGWEPSDHDAELIDAAFALEPVTR